MAKRVRVAGATFRVVVVSSLDGYPAVVLGRTVYLEGTGDSAMDRAVAREAARRAMLLQICID